MGYVDRMFNHNYFNMQISHLYHLKPIGIGTPYVESLTGYIKRLAEVHKVSVGILYVKEIAPSDIGGNLNSNKRQKFLGKNAKDLNSCCKESREIIRILTEKTKTSGLSFLTMGTFEDFFNPRYMLREYQAWCPICFEESREEGKKIYEQLLWNFNDVKTCNKHQVMLVDKCPLCNGRVSILASLSRVGFCNNCGCWLGSKDYKNYCNNNEWHNWVFNNLGQLLALAPKMNRDNKFCLSKNLTNLISGANMSIRTLANMTNVAHSTIRFWILGHRPQINNALSLSYLLGYSLVDILMEEISTFETFMHDRKTTLPPKNVNIKIDLDKLKTIIEDSINSNKGLSLSQISSLTGVSLDAIRRHFPREVITLKIQYNERLKQLKEERLNSIKRTMISLHSRGVYPSMKALGRELGKRVIINDEERKLWITTLEELRYKVEL